MGKYVFIYYGGMENSKEVMDAWMKWFGVLGDKLVDGGNPFNDGGQAVNQDGVMPIKDMPATGYSIVSANSMDEATNMAKDCPVNTTKNGAVLVYEAMPM